MKKKQIKFKKMEMTIFTLIVLIVTALIFVYGIVKLFFEKTDAGKSHLIFIICESLIMFGLILLPTIISKITKLKIPPMMEILYMIFCVASIIFGEIADFYGRVQGWDSLLHICSGVLFGVLGYVIINTFNHFNGTTIKFSPIFVCFWVICFSLAMGAFWELFEFLCDEFLGTNMQQYLESNSTFSKGEPLVGHDALKDTMKDLALDLVGSLISAIIGFFELKKQKKGIASLYLEKTNIVETKKDNELIHIEEIPSKEETDNNDDNKEEKTNNS